MADVSIKTECYKLRQSLSSGVAFEEKKNLRTAVDKQPSSPQQVTELTTDNDTLKVLAGNDLSATCAFKKDAPVTIKEQPSVYREIIGGGDAKDEGYACDVKLTKPIDVGGTSPSDQLSFVWLKGRAGMSGKDKSKSKKEAAPGYSWYYKERTWGNWTAWKGSSAAFSPSFTGVSASLTVGSLGVTGLSITMAGVEVKLVGFVLKGWLFYWGYSMFSLQMKGAGVGTKFVSVCRCICNKSALVSLLDADAVDNEK